MVRSHNVTPINDRDKHGCRSIEQIAFPRFRLNNEAQAIRTACLMRVGLCVTEVSLAASWKLVYRLEQTLAGVILKQILRPHIAA